MPREDQHDQKARQNEIFAESIVERGNDTKEGWAVVVAFYSALHYIQAYLVRFGAGDSDNHHKRFEEIKGDPKLQPILAQYKYLYTLGHTSRYKCHALPNNPYAIAKSHLETIKKQVAYAMGK